MRQSLTVLQHNRLHLGHQWVTHHQIEVYIAENTWNFFIWKERAIQTLKYSMIQVNNSNDFAEGLGLDPEGSNKPKTSLERYNNNSQLMSHHRATASVNPAPNITMIQLLRLRPKRFGKQFVQSNLPFSRFYVSHFIKSLVKHGDITKGQIFSMITELQAERWVGI